MARIVELLRSPVTRYSGRQARVEPVDGDLVDRLEIRAGLGVVGDRYFNKPAHRDAAVTIIASTEVARFGVGLLPLRRNISIEGVEVDAGRGRRLALDCGEGVVVLWLRRPAQPCRWLDLNVGDGAWRALRGRAGMRCEPLSDGALRIGPVDARWLDD